MISLKTTSRTPKLIFETLEDRTAPSIPTSSSMFSSSSSANFGSSITFYDTVSAVSGTASPTGSVALVNPNTGLVLGTGTLTGIGSGSSQAQITLPNLPVGQTPIMGIFIGNSMFDTSLSAVLNETINPVATPTTSSLFSSQTTANAGTPIPFYATVFANAGSASPTGTISLVNASTGATIATGTLSSIGSGVSQAVITVSALPVGTTPVKAVYAGNSNFSASSSAPVTETINPVATPTTSSLFSSQTTANAGTPIPFYATVFANAGSASPTGTISLVNASTGATIATGTLSSIGSGVSQAVITVSALPVGTTPVKAVYAGNSNFSASSSAPVTETIQTVGGYTAADVANAQQELRNTTLHPEMTNMWTQVKNPPITNGSSNRSANAYAAVIDQFDVQYSNAGRYRPSNQYNFTRCNIFAGDVMRAMGAPLPTKGDIGINGPDGNPDPMTANATSINSWLKNGNGDWRKIDLNSTADRATLLAHVRAGKPAVASAPELFAGYGHIAVLRPDQVISNLDTDNIGSLVVSQAGGSNYNRANLSFVTGWSSRNFQGVDFFIHN